MGEYVVEYAITGRSKCQDAKCKQQIEKGELRIGKEMPAPPHWTKGSEVSSIMKWYHGAHFFVALTRARGTTEKPTSTKQFRGFEDLKEEDQKDVQKWITLLHRITSAKAVAAAAVATARSSPKKSKRKPVAEMTKASTPDSNEDKIESSDELSTEEEEEDEDEAETKTSKGSHGVATKRRDAVFTGLTFCLSGKLSRSKQANVTLIMENGGKVKGLVTKEVTHVLAQEVGSAKTRVAEEKRLPIVNETWLDECIATGHLLAETGDGGTHGGSESEVDDGDADPRVKKTDHTSTSASSLGTRKEPRMKTLAELMSGVNRAR